MLTTTMMRIKSNLEGAGVSTAVFAQVVGIPNSSLADAFADRRYLGAQREADLLETASRVAAIVSALKPFTLAKVTGVKTLKELIESSKEPEEIKTIISLLGVSK